MKLGELRKPFGSTKKNKRIGRGPGSGHGKTSTRGHKGQKARAGSVARRAWSEGGQMPLQRRVPKRGFTNIFKKEYQIVNLGSLEELAGEGIISPETLKAKGLTKKSNVPVKILAGGEITKGITIRAHFFSKKAQEKITSLGGKAEVIK
ncbi:MAG TPA: 50S ribosomal protein L15 [candidate division Zixibacteria bacterium]